jgi:hypothetical protein
VEGKGIMKVKAVSVHAGTVSIKVRARGRDGLEIEAHHLRGWSSNSCGEFEQGACDFECLLGITSRKQYFLKVTKSIKV